MNSEESEEEEFEIESSRSSDDEQPIHSVNVSHDHSAGMQAGPWGSWGGPAGPVPGVHYWDHPFAPAALLIAPYGRRDRPLDSTMNRDDFRYYCFRCIRTLGPSGGDQIWSHNCYLDLYGERCHSCNFRPPERNEYRLFSIHGFGSDGESRPDGGAGGNGGRGSIAAPACAPAVENGGPSRIDCG